MARLPEATGDVAVNLAADLQDPPELIPEMMKALKEKETDIVWAVRRTRKESVFHRIGSRIFCFLMKRLALKETPSSGADIFLINRKVIDSIASFLYFPIRLISASGILISTGGFLYAIIIIINALIYERIQQGWPALMVVILVLSGFQLLMLGIVAEYLWRTFSEVQRRPPFIISERAGFPSSSSGTERDR